MTTLAGRYELEGELGRGGMAVVYRARHVHTGRIVAVKLVLPEYARSPEVVSRFIDEARVSGRMGPHPHIVDVTDADVDTATGQPFFAMELLDGETLATRLERGPMPWGQATVLFEQLGDALGHAHRAGVVHRDIKPGNLFLTRSRKGTLVLKVVDFGIAKLTNDTGTATSIGTPLYAAPEQLGPAMRRSAEKRGVTVASNVSPATDVWALGLVAYETLTGHPPGQFWDATTAADLAIQQSEAITGAPPASERAGSAAPSLPAGFDAWFARCLAYDARVRPPEAESAMAELVAILRAEQQGLALEATVAAPPGPSSRSTRTPADQLGAAPTELAPVPEVPNATPGATTRLTTGRTLFPEELSSTGAAPHAPARRGRRASLLASATVMCAIAIAGVLWKRSHDREVTRDAARAGELARVRELSSIRAAGKMVRIPGGSFDMGSSEYADEKDEKGGPHRVEVKTFFLDETEVTTTAYTACVEAKACKDGGALSDPIWSAECNFGKPDRGAHPINCVDWEQARAFCAWASKRLPTEAEWEYAARGSAGRTYPWGDDPPGPNLLNACDADCLAWSTRNGKTLGAMFAGSDGFETTPPVGSFPAGKTPEGILDLAGNVWEWVEDEYCDSYAPNRKCAGGRGDRGGAWFSGDPAFVRGAVRSRYVATFRSPNSGIRCARDN